MPGGVISGLEQQPHTSFADAATELLKQMPAVRSVAAQTSPLAAADSATQRDMCSMDSLIREVATPRTRATLQEYEGQAKACHPDPLFLRSSCTSCSFGRNDP